MNKTLKRLPLAVAILSALGTQSAVAQVSQDESSVVLDTIHATLDRQGAKVKTNVVTLQEKDKSTETDLRGLLKEEPAIEVGGGNGMSQFFYIRGMGQNSVDVKIDGAYTDSQILYHQGRFMLDPSLIKIVSVQKGAGSASAGIGATNGAIVAETLDASDLLKNSANPNYGAKVNLGYSSNNGRSYSVSAFGKQGDFDGLVSINRVDESNYKPGNGFKNALDGSDRVPYSALDKRGILAKVGYDVNSQHRLELSHMQEQHRGVRTVREEFTIDDTPGSRTSTARQAPSYRETTLSNTNLEWTGSNLGFVDYIKANVYKMNNKRYSADDSGCGYCGNIAGKTTTNIHTRGANINLDTKLAQDLTVKYGVNYRHQKISPDRFLISNIQSPEKTDIGVYAEAIRELGEFTLTGGLRYDKFDFKAMDGKSVSDDALNSSFGVIYEPNAVQGLSLSATRNYATRSPRLYDALLTHGKRGVTSIADGIKAERARNTELGFNYNIDNVTVDGSYFWQKIDNAIANPQDRHNGANKVRETTNAGYIKNHGYELGVSYRNNGLTARLGVSESKPRIYDTHPQNLLSSNPEFAVQTGRTWTGSLAYQFAEPNVEVGVRHRAVESVDAADNSVLVRTAGTAERKGYNFSDIYANWKPYGNNKMNVNFSVNNVFDKHYYSHGQRGTTLPGIGRDFRVGVNFTY